MNYSFNTQHARHMKNYKEYGMDDLYVKSLEWRVST
jgi:hypothetical protein